jgi:CDP-glucose 4,6-dehydratase
MEGLGHSVTDSNFWTDRNVLVTGSTGLLGSWLTESLVQAGVNVVGVIRDSIPRSRLIQSGVIDQINIVWGKVEDYQLLERCLNEYEVQTVFHLAAQTIVGTANANPLSTFESNIQGSWNLLEACRRSSRVQEIVVASSDKAYGEHVNLPYDEDSPLQGRHPYDVSKSCVDLIAQAYFATYDLPVCVTRFGNLFGGGDLNFNRLIPGTIRSIIRNEAPVIRSDGQFSRDYIYVEDAVKAYMLLAEKMSVTSGLKGQALNFSYESPLTAIQAVDIIRSITGRNDLQSVILNSTNGEIMHQFLNSAKSHQILGWQPSFTFDSGMERTIQWYTEFFESKVLNDPRRISSTPAQNT